MWLLKNELKNMIINGVKGVHCDETNESYKTENSLGLQ